MDVSDINILQTIYSILSASGSRYLQFSLYSELNSWEDIVELAFDDDDCVAGLRSDGKVLLAGNCPYSVSDWDLID